MYYTKLGNTITTFNENNDALLSNASIQDGIVKVVIKYEEELKTDANNVFTDAFIHASSSQRENMDLIFTSEKLDKLDELVNTINNLTIDNCGYE